MNRKSKKPKIVHTPPRETARMISVDTTSILSTVNSFAREIERQFHERGGQGFPKKWRSRDMYLLIGDARAQLKAFKHIVREDRELYHAEQAIGAVIRYALIALAAFTLKHVKKAHEVAPVDEGVVENERPA